MGSPFLDDMQEFEQAIGEVLPAGFISQLVEPDLTYEDGVFDEPDDPVVADMANDNEWPL